MSQTRSKFMATVVATIMLWSSAPIWKVEATFLASLAGPPSREFNTVPTSFRRLLAFRRLAVAPEPSTTSVVAATTDANEPPNNPYGLTPELLKISNSFESIGDDKLRYKQLLFMANQLAPMDPSSQRPENKVPGCLSTVFIDGTCTKDDALGKDGVYRIQFVGDSDGLLTKGLVALLVRGLSGNTAADIQLVDPAFIQQAGIATSLTPGRNNGFLNMLAVIKRKALELEAIAKEADQHSSSMLPNTAQQPDAVEAASASQINNPNPKYAAMIAALQKLEPTVLDLQDVSYQHAGHMEAGNGSETHFELDIVSDAFDGLNLIKRHKLVYSTLGDIMPQIHALQIRAKTSAES